MKKIIPLLLVIPLVGCSTRALNALAKNLKGDQAIVVGKVSSIYGTVSLVRIGGTTYSVTVAPDGTVSVNK